MTEFAQHDLGPDDGVPAQPQRGPRLESRAWDAMRACLDLAEGALSARLSAETGLSLARHGLLAKLCESAAGVTMSQLSRALRVTNANVTALVEGLVREGWVERLSVPDDRRRVAVRLTDTARRAFEPVAALHESALTGLFAGLSPSEIRLLTGLLEKLRRRLQEEQADQDPPSRKRNGGRAGMIAGTDTPGWGWV